MIQAGNQKERHTLPRWNSIKTATALGELAPTRDANRVPMSFGDELSELLNQWKFEHNLPLAVEIISTARVLQSEEDVSEIERYAKEIVSSMPQIPSLLKELLFENVDKASSDLFSHQDCISMTKQRLLRYPRNPLLWTELSREYTIMGQKSKGEKAILVAHDLAPENRTVLRSLARFYAHIGDSEHALSFLRNSSIVKVDPWVLATEIALSNEAGRMSKNVKIAQNMILDSNLHPLSLSELASELGTMDICAGNSKKGKKKFEIAILRPHENAIAQIVWVNKNVYSVESFIPSITGIKCNYEAGAQLAFESQEWKNAFDIAGLWQEYQPFSRGPAMLSSFVASDFLMDYKSAINTLSCSLKSNPDDCNLLNNYAYALILDNQLPKATDIYVRANKLCGSKDNIPLIATGGLLLYRKGKAEEGKQKYLQAIELAKKKKDYDLLYRANLCLAREEKRIEHPINDLIKEIKNPRYASLQELYGTVINNFGLM